jgi:KUP system potassium uptake protein
MGQQLGEADKQLSRYSKVPAAPGAVNPAEHTAGAAIAHQTTASSQPAAGARGLNAAIKRSLATSHAAQVVLMVVVVIATSMVVGDGILTPAISVLSAVTGLKAADGVSISQGGWLCWHAGPLGCSCMCTS